MRNRFLFGAALALAAVVATAATTDNARSQYLPTGSSGGSSVQGVVVQQQNADGVHADPVNAQHPLSITCVSGCSGGGGSTVSQGTAAAAAGAWPFYLTDLTFILGTASHPVRTDPTGTTTQPVSLASAPLPSNAAQETGGHLATVDTSTAAISAASGAIADAAWSGSGNSTIIAALKAIYNKLVGTLTVTISGALTGITPTDRTIASTSGSSQTLMAANASRHALTIENTGNANCGVNLTGGTAVIGGAGTQTIAPLGSVTPRIPTLSAVTVICTAGQPVYADEQ